METEVSLHKRLVVGQVFELAEIFGFESRNKYRIRDEAGTPVAYAAEQHKTFWGWISRQFLGHWRTFDIHFFLPNRQEFMIAHHPFRWFFQRLEVRLIDGTYVGAIERRFSILSKRFHVENATGQTVMEVSSPFWKLWQFPFYRQGREVARISKKWSGLGAELFTDKDNFVVDMSSPELTAGDRNLIVAASIYVDLLFFEHKGSGGVLGIFD